MQHSRKKLRNGRPAKFPQIVEAKDIDLEIGKSYLNNVTAHVCHNEKIRSKSYTSYLAITEIIASQKSGIFLIFPDVAHLCPNMI